MAPKRESTMELLIGKPLLARSPCCAHRRHGLMAASSRGIRHMRRRIYLESGGDAQKFAANREMVRTFILAVREGWSALDRRGVKPAPFALRAIFCWVPMLFAIKYWQRLFGSRGELYFAGHVRHAPAEMAALAADVRELLDTEPTPCLTDSIRQST